MLEIKVNKDDVKVKGEGNPMTLTAEMGVVVANVVEVIIKDCPDDFLDCMKTVVTETLTFAVDKAFEKN